MGFYTYLHCKPDGTPFYVGKGAGIRAYEWRHRNQHHRNTVAKYGRQHIGVFVFPCESERQAFDDEIQQIATLRADGYELVNQTAGGQGISGCRHSPEARSNMSLGQRGNTKNRGRKHSAEARERMATAQRGNKKALGNKSRSGMSQSEETRAKIAAWHLGKKHFQETKEKMSIAQKLRRARRV